MSNLLSEILKNSEVDIFSDKNSHKNLDDLISVYQQEQYTKSIVNLQKAILAENVEVENLRKLQSQINLAKEKNKELFDKINTIKNNIDNHYKQKKQLKQKFANTKDSESLNQLKQTSKTAQFINRKPNLKIPEIFYKLFGKNFDTYKNSIDISIQQIQDLSKRQIFEKSKYLMHELVMQEMHFKKLYKLFYFFNKEQTKFDSKSKKKFDYPTDRIKGNNNLVKTFERKIYQHLEGFCNRGIQMDQNKRNILKNAFKKDRSTTKTNKKQIKTKKLKPVIDNVSQERQNLKTRNLNQKIKSQNKKKKIKFEDKEAQNKTVQENIQTKNNLQSLNKNIKEEQINKKFLTQQNLDESVKQDNKKHEDHHLNQIKVKKSQKKISSKKDLQSSNLTLEYLSQNQDLIHDTLKEIQKKIHKKENKNNPIQVQTPQDINSEKFLQNNFKLIHQYLTDIQNQKLHKVNDDLRQNQIDSENQKLDDNLNFLLEEVSNFQQSYQSLQNVLEQQKQQSDKLVDQLDEIKEIDIVQNKFIDQDKDKIMKEQLNINNQISADGQLQQINEKQYSDKEIKKEEERQNQIITNDQLSNQKLQEDSKKSIKSKESFRELSWTQVFQNQSNENLQDKKFKTIENSLYADQQKQSVQKESDKELIQNQMILTDSKQSYEYTGQTFNTKLNSLQQMEIMSNGIQQIDLLLDANDKTKEQQNLFGKKNWMDQQPQNDLNLTNSDQYLNNVFQSKLNSLDQLQTQKLYKDNFQKDNEDNSKSNANKNQQRDIDEINNNTSNFKDDINEKLKKNNWENIDNLNNFDTNNNSKNTEGNLNQEKNININNSELNTQDKQEKNDMFKKEKSFSNSKKIINLSQKEIQDQNKKSQIEDELAKTQKDNQNNQEDTQNLNQNDTTEQKNEKEKLDDDQSNENDLDYFNIQNTLDEQLSELFYEQIKKPLEMQQSISNNLSNNFKVNDNQDSNFSTFNPNINQLNSELQIYAQPFEMGQSFGKISTNSAGQKNSQEENLPKKKESKVPKNLKESISKDRFMLDGANNIYNQQELNIKKYQNSIRNQPVPQSKQLIESVKEIELLNNFKKKDFEEQLQLSNLNNSNEFQMDKIDKDLILVSESLSNVQNKNQIAENLLKSKEQHNSNENMNFYQTQSYKENQDNVTISQFQLQNQSELKDLDKLNSELQQKIKTQINSLASIRNTDNQQNILQNNLQDQQNKLFTESNEHHQILYNKFQTKPNSMDRIPIKNQSAKKISSMTMEHNLNNLQHEDLKKKESKQNDFNKQLVSLSQEMIQKPINVTDYNSLAKD